MCYLVICYDPHKIDISVSCSALQAPSRSRSTGGAEISVSGSGLLHLRSCQPLCSPFLYQGSGHQLGDSHCTTLVSSTQTRCITEQPNWLQSCQPQALPTHWDLRSHWIRPNRCVTLHPQPLCPALVPLSTAALSCNCCVVVWHCCTPLLHSTTALHYCSPLLAVPWDHGVLGWQALLRKILEHVPLGVAAQNLAQVIHEAHSAVAHSSIQLILLVLPDLSSYSIICETHGRLSNHLLSALPLGRSLHR